MYLVFSFYISNDFGLLLYEYHGLCPHRIRHSYGKTQNCSKWKRKTKKLIGFFLHKHSISQKVECKPLFSEEYYLSWKFFNSSEPMLRLPTFALASLAASASAAIALCSWTGRRASLLKKKKKKNGIKYWQAVLTDDLWLTFPHVPPWYPRQLWHHPGQSK